MFKDLFYKLIQEYQVIQRKTNHYVGCSWVPNTFLGRTLASNLVRTNHFVHEVIFMILESINQVKTPYSSAFNPKNVQQHEQSPEVPRRYLTLPLKKEEKKAPPFCLDDLFFQKPTRNLLFFELYEIVNSFLIQ